MSPIPEFSSRPFRRPVERFVPNPKLKFLDQCGEVMRFGQFSRRPVETCRHGSKHFILWIHRAGRKMGDGVWEMGGVREGGGRNQQCIGLHAGCIEQGKQAVI